MTSEATGKTRVVVVGGGVIGLCSAYFLRRVGLEVTLLEGGRTGQAASKGNAGWITPVLSAPVPAPGVISHGLWSLRDPDSPLYLKPSALPRLAPWLLKFATHSRRGPFQRGLDAMARFGMRALPAYERLREDGVDVRLHGDGLLFCFAEAAHIQPALRDLDQMTRYGYSTPELLTGTQLRDLEPALSDRVAGGFMVPQERYVHPGTLTSLLDETVRSLGVEVREEAAVSGFERDGLGVTGAVVNGSVVTADLFVLAAGAWTGRLCELLGAGLPIQAGKGYSFAVPMRTLPRQPLYLHEARVGASPFGDHLRLAGTMELSGINTVLDRRRIEAIARSSQLYFREPLAEPRVEEWVGMRPLAPDGLPVIGRLRAAPNVFVATGHSMLGMTLGPATGELVAGMMITGQTPAGFEPFSPARFRR